MKIVYLDTNIIISYIKNDDIFHIISKTIMDAKTIERIASPITLIELSSVISRQFENLKFDITKIPHWETLNLVEKKVLITLYFLETLPLHFYSCLGTEKIHFKRRDLMIHLDFAKTYRIAPFFSLRALDNLQIAAAINLRDVKNLKIDYFITTDKVILDQSKAIQKTTKLTVIDPEQLITIEHL